MKLPLETPANPAQTDEGGRLVERALRKFLRKDLRVSLLYTGGNRQTVRFTGLLDSEAKELAERGLARVVKVDPGHRFRVTLTAEGNRARDELARRAAAGAWS